MHGLGQMAKTQDLAIQSHLSENAAEISWVAALHPDARSYAHVYDQHGLLTSRTYLAHCIWCTREENQLLVDRKVGIVHCPNSNFSLSSGVLNVAQVLADFPEMKIGLGTDVSGGSSPSMLDAIRQAILASKLSVNNQESSSTLKKQTQDDHPAKKLKRPEVSHDALGYAEAFYLATVGSARCLGLEANVGSFHVGKCFDALLVNVDVPLSPIDAHLDVHLDESFDVTFQRFLFIGDDRNVEQVFVSGQRVK